MNDKQRGMSIVELLIVIAITGVLTAVILAFAISYMRLAGRQQADMTSLVGRLNASDYLREHLSQSSGLSTQNSIVDPNVGAQDPAQSAGYWLELHAVPGLKTNASAVTPILYFKKQSVNTANQVVYNNQLAYEDEYILYMDSASKQLRVRVLANPDVVNNRTVTSCPPENTTSTCPADRVLVEHLTGVEMTYYSRSGNEIDFQSVVQTDEFGNPVYDGDGNPIYEGPDFPVVEVAELSLKLTVNYTAAATDITNSSTIIRVALRNN